MTRCNLCWNLTNYCICKIPVRLDRLTPKSLEDIDRVYGGSRRSREVFFNRYIQWNTAHVDAELRVLLDGAS